MEIAIIGGSAAGLYSAIYTKLAHPDYSVRLYEKNDRFGKKLAATGNGHCNILNKELTFHRFHESLIARDLFEKYPYDALSKALSSIGVMTFSIGDLVYPLSYHAPSYVKFLVDTAESLGVQLVPNAKLSSYNALKRGYRLYFADESSARADRIIFALGGKSQSKFGSDGAFFSELTKHGYTFTRLVPSLCPIKVKEKVNSLSGLRHKALVKLFVNNVLAYIETGEVLFKDDGLSGIAIMNASSYAARAKKGEPVSITLDLFPSFPFAVLKEMVMKARENNPSFYLDTLFERPIKEYLLRFCGLFDKETLSEDDLDALLNKAKALPFQYESNYGFDHSQATCGGLKSENFDARFASTKEKGVFFVGEMIDVDGICGGYNLSFALASALEVSNSL